MDSNFAQPAASFPLVPELEDRFLLYNINTIANREVTRLKTMSIRGLLVDPKSNSLN